MDPAQYRDVTFNTPGLKRVYFEWVMTAATTFTIVQSSELLAGVAGIVRTGVGVYDIFPIGKPIRLKICDASVVQAAPANTGAGSAKTTFVDALTASGKVTLTFRRADTFAAADMANTDRVFGYLDFQTVAG